MRKVFLRLLLINFCHLFFPAPSAVLGLITVIIMLATLMKKDCISAVVSVPSCGRGVEKATWK